MLEEAIIDLVAVKFVAAGAYYCSLEVSTLYLDISGSWGVQFVDPNTSLMRPYEVTCILYTGEASQVWHRNLQMVPQDNHVVATL